MFDFPSYDQDEMVIGGNVLHNRLIYVSRRLIYFYIIELNDCIAESKQALFTLYS